MGSEKARAVAQQLGRGRSTRDDLFKAFLKLGELIDNQIRPDSAMGRFRDKLQGRRPAQTPPPTKQP